MTDELLIRINQSGIVRIEVGGEKIGLISSLKLEADSNEALPTLEVKFPELPKDLNSPMKDKLQGYKEMMEKLPYCKIITKSD